MSEVKNIQILIEDKLIDAVEVNVTGEDYLQCEEFSTVMWAREKTGFYGKGILNSTDDPYKAQRIGCLGEMALSKLLSIPPNFSYKENGEKEDFTVGDKTIDVKTAASNYGAGLIRVVNEKGSFIPLECNYYLFGYLQAEDRSIKGAKVALIGYLDRPTIVNSYAVVKARKGTHQNYEIPYSDLNSLDSFFSLTN